MREVPRCYWFRIGPKAAMLAPGLHLKHTQMRAQRRILLIPPRETSSHDFLIQYAAVGQVNVGYYPAVTINVAFDDGYQLT